ncbi:hypothetical protein C8Q78DRAFT_1024292 [Trametes maxima]|nr:hypothetical protein C8Q78DRAFT_1024292 [Trametes maxima]
MVFDEIAGVLLVVCRCRCRAGCSEASSRLVVGVARQNPREVNEKPRTWPVAGRAESFWRASGTETISEAVSLSPSRARACPETLWPSRARCLVLSAARTVVC